MSEPVVVGVDVLREQLAAAGQEHLLTYWEGLDEQHRLMLERQLAAIDWKRIPALVEGYVLNKPHLASEGGIEPVSCYRADGSNWNRADYKAKGAELIAAGKVAAFTVAGGQGTRLGYDGPKGCFPGAAVTNKPLFACLAEWIAAAQSRYCRATHCAIPWYIMTSPLNHAATVRFFKENGYFGLKKHDVMFFTQGVMPSFDMATGKVLLDQTHMPAVSPDGHGGSIKAMADSGALADMVKRGVEHLSYTQIDNPLVRVIDPAFIGLHAFAPDSSGEMSSKMCPKAGPDEKVGVICKVGGKAAVVEYSDMPVELSRAVGKDGRLKFEAGNIAVHVIGVKFLQKLTEGGSDVGIALPYHRAEKKVPFVDIATGQRVEPAKANAVKLELFVFDALPLAEKSIVLETERVEEFAPIKNAEGADSPESCRRIQTKRAAKWLAAVGKGSVVPLRADGEPDCTLELSPLHAMEAEDLRVKTVKPIARGDEVVL
jgi:UDP-N-acetylglucosamine/UDP-N-acetylgalactosamine diphosphorylase